MGSSNHIVVLAVTLLYLSLSCSCSTHHYPTKGVDLGNPVIDVVPSRLAGYSSTRDSKDILSCERVRVAGLSRLKLSHYANSFRVTLAPSVLIPERLCSKIQVCFHRNASLGICQCEDDEWKPVQKGIWSSVMSPYEERFVDVKFIGDVSGSVTVSVEEDFQLWRLLCLASGFILLLLAPIVSSWVPFYYSSSMAVGVLLVIIIILFQGMKLLPTGRKNVFYLTIYGSVLGAGSFLLHQFSVLVNSILTNFGLSEEMHNPVSIFVLVGIVLAGAALGYWIVRKFVISEDGSVDVGVAQFVKWAMRIIATTCILQSTIDTPLAVGTLACCWALCFLITSLNWENLQDLSYSGKGTQVSRRMKLKQSRAEFRSRSTKTGSRGTFWNSPNNSPAWSNSPVKGLISPSSGRSSGTRNEQEYYSTFHKTPTRKKFSKKAWDNFTRESTKQAVAEWASSPEFTDWIVEHADRIQLLPNDSSNDSAASGSDSTEESPPETGNPFNLFNLF